MEIMRLGHSCFRLRGKALTIIMDPFNPDAVGLKLVKQSADVVTVSHGHDDHNYLEAVKAKGESLFDITGPGEYELSEVRITGWKTFHDDKKGEERGKNTVFKIEIDGVSVLHLGDLGHALSESLIDDMGDVDVLLVPVGGTYTIDYMRASSIVKQIDPRIVIPMHYKVEGMNPEIYENLDGVDKFLNEIGEENSAPESKLNVTAGKLPEDLEVVVLE